MQKNEWKCYTNIEINKIHFLNNNIIKHVLRIQNQFPCPTFTPCPKTPSN